MGPSWMLLLAATLATSSDGIKVSVSKSTTVEEKKIHEVNSTSSPTPAVYVTPSSLPVLKRTAKKPKKVKTNYAAESRENVATAPVKRIDTFPTKFTFTPNFADLQRQPSFNYQRHRQQPKAESPPENSISSVPATYESIVYDPGSKDATAEFMRSEMWETPELVVQDTNQRQEGKNSLITTSSRIEYSPNLKQTPLNQIQFKGPRQQYYNPPPTAPQRIQPRIDSPDEEEEESESQQSEVDDDESEELNEEEEQEQEEEEKPRYPVNLQENETPFNPFQNVQEPDDIYSDVLSNIGSVFDDDGGHNANPKGEFPVRSERPGHITNLLPQFEQYSYENLREQEKEDDGDYVEDNEELAEYEDEADETRQVNQKKPQVTTLPPRVFHPPPRNHYQKKHKPAKENLFKESPFPNVKIVGEKSLAPKKEKPEFSFSPWLPTQAPFSTWPKPQASASQQKPTKPKAQSSQHWSQSTIPPREAVVEEATTKRPYSWEQIVEKRRKPSERNEHKAEDDRSHHRNAVDDRSHYKKSEDDRSHYKKSEDDRSHYKKPEDNLSHYKGSEKDDETESEEDSRPYYTSYETSQTENSKNPENDDEEGNKPYHASYKTSYNKSWKSASPKKNEKSAYDSSWRTDEPVAEKKEKYKQEQRHSESRMEVKKPKKRLKKSKKTGVKDYKMKVEREPLQPRPVTEEVLESRSIFVTPVPTLGENVTTEIKSGTAGVTTVTVTTEEVVDVIDDLYDQQHNSL